MLLYNDKLSTRHNTSYNYYYYLFMAEQPALAGTPVKNCRILLEQSFTAHMPLLTATGVFGLWRRC